MNWKKLLTFLQRRVHQQQGNEPAAMPEAGPPADWTHEEVRQLIFTWVQKYMAPSFDESQTATHEIVQSYRDIFHETERFLAEMGENDGEDIGTNEPFVQYGLIHDGTKGHKGAWVLDSYGLREITMREYDDLISTRKKGTFSVWPHHHFSFSVREDRKNVLISHGDCPMAMLIYTQNIVRTDGHLELARDPDGFFMMS